MPSLTAGLTNYGTQSVLVGAGDDGNFFGNTVFDLNGGVDGNEFVYTSLGNFCGITCGGDVVWTLSDLDFGQSLTGFTILQQSISPITVVSLTSNSVSFRYSDLAISKGTNVIGRFEFNSAVPEPSTWAMMLLGFGFVGGAMRHAKRRQKLTISFA